MQTLNGTYTSATLPAPSTVLPGTLAYTSDAGVMTSVSLSNSTYKSDYWAPSAQSQLKKKPFMPAGVQNIQPVMATPPTVAISTTNPLAAGLQFSPFNNSQQIGGGGSVDLSFCSVSRAVNPQVASLTSPLFAYVRFQHVSATAGGVGYNGGNTVQFGVMHSGLSIVLMLHGLSTNVIAKVNDQYVTLTPTAVPANNVANFYSLTFSAAALRRIDFIVDNVLGSCNFGGFFVSEGDVLYPAQIRGPRVIVMGDSFTTATGAGCSALGFSGVLADYMGWDDIIPSGIGGTGIIATGSGTYCNYNQRVATDVYPWNPDEVIIQGFFNDNSSTGAAIQAALLTLVQGIVQNLPYCRVTLFGPYVNTGSGNHTGAASLAASGFNATRLACQNVAAFFNSPQVKYIDPTTGPAPPIPQTLTLTNAVSANATTFLTTNIGFVTQGATYQWPNGERSFVRSRSGYTATVDRVASAWPIGTPIVQVGNCYMRGAGFQGAPTGIGNADNLVFTDDIHPSALGHIAIGSLLGVTWAPSLNT